MYIVYLFLIKCTADPLYLHSFPTRRSSDLGQKPLGLFGGRARRRGGVEARAAERERHDRADQDRKSTRLNSSHANISYAVFCLKKKKTYNVAILQRVRKALYSLSSTLYLTE